MKWSSMAVSLFTSHRCSWGPGRRFGREGYDGRWGRPEKVGSLVGVTMEAGAGVVN